MPGSFQNHAINGVPHVPASMPPIQSFTESDNAPFEYPFSISGVTRDANGNALGNCTVIVFRTADLTVAAQGVSDANGNYNLGASPAVSHFLVAYLAGSPDVEGTTVNTLVGA